jgi:WD40 repeat protein
MWSFRVGILLRSVCISSNGKYMAAEVFKQRELYHSYFTPQVVFFSRENAAPKWSYWGSHKYSRFPVSISSDGNFIAVGGLVHLFSRFSSDPLWIYNPEECIISISISSDGSHIAAGGGAGGVYLFHTDDNSPLWIYQTGGDVVSVSISADGSHIAAGGEDNRVYLFGRSDNRPLWSCRTGGRVNSVAISSDGNYVVAGSADGGVYLFTREIISPPALVPQLPLVIIGAAVVAIVVVGWVFTRKTRWVRPTSS